MSEQQTLEEIVARVFKAYPRTTNEARTGQEAFHFLVGQVIRELSLLFQPADSKRIYGEIEKQLERRSG